MSFTAIIEFKITDIISGGGEGSGVGIGGGEFEPMNQKRGTSSYPKC